MSPGAGRSAQHDGAPSTETDLPRRPPWLSWPVSVPLCVGSVFFSPSGSSVLLTTEVLGCGSFGCVLVYFANRILK